MLPDNQNNYFAILDSLKQKIRQAQLKAAHSVNAQMLSIYWEIGNTIIVQQKIEGWGAKIIDRLAADLKVEFPNETGFSIRNLKYMRAFAEAYPFMQYTQDQLEKLNIFENQKNTILQEGLDLIVQPAVAQLNQMQTSQLVQTLVAQIPWTHHTKILDKTKELHERLFYIKKAIENGWSKNILKLQIDNDLYQRQGNTINNFAATLPIYESDIAQETFKSPYIFDFLTLSQDAKEKDIEKGLVQHLKKFMLELGRGFAYVGNQFNLKVENDEYFLDLLFYNINLHCYVVFELKIGDFMPEHAGKLNFYINTVDGEIKGENDNPTIGILLCKMPNKTEVKYALRGINTPLGIAEYEFTNALPKQLTSEMPTIEELEAEIEKEYQELKSPSQKRIEKLKASLSQFQKNELKQTATTEILFEIIDKSVVPLYQAVIASMDDFTDLFYSKSYHFVGKQGPIQEISKLAEDWKDEEFLKSKYEFHFNYSLRGLKKVGTEAIDSNYGLNFKIDIYSYSFIILNYNNSQSFTKKLYHEQLTKQEITKIVELFYNMVLDDIERQIELLKED